MSCNLVKHASIGNLKSLKQILLPDEKTDQELLRDDDWDNRWNWDTSDLYPSLTKPEQCPNRWLSNCLISLSPFKDLLAFAYDVNIAIYKLTKQSSNETNNDDNKSDKPNEMSLVWSTTLVNLEPNETITSILCVPLVSQQKTSTMTPDWTCVIVGFSTGFVRIYTGDETGGLLIGQRLHDQSVIALKCQTFDLCHQSDYDQSDEILVVYDNNVVVLIDAFVLYQTLRSCRSQLARAQSTTRGFGFDFINNKTIDLPSISFVFKKFHLQAIEKVTDCDNLGVFSNNLYDHLVSQSIQRGPDRQPRANLPLANILVTTGDNPYIGFYRAHESENQTILNEMAQAVISKVKNFVPTSLFGLSNKSSSEESLKPKIEPSIPLSLRLGLFDQNRDGMKIILAPNRRLAAITDDFGRVTLVDIDKMIALRMWKGYRDAEIGWIEANEDKLSSTTSSTSTSTRPSTSSATSTTTTSRPSTNENNKKALFLLIYAPKRGILEIWFCQSGTRVSAFNVGKTCRLYQCNYSMIGLNSLIIKQYNKYPEILQPKCFLIDYNTAIIYQIQVPFLCALTDKNSKRTRDLHLLKELNNYLNASEDKNKIISTILEIKTPDVKRQALESVIHNNKFDLCHTVCGEVKNQLLSLFKTNELDYENQLIAQMCQRIQQLCKLYSIVNQQHTSVEQNIINDSINPPDIQDLVNILGWEGPSIVRCLSLVVFKNTIKKQTKDQVFSSKQLTIQEFLSFFTLYTNLIIKDKDNKILLDNVPVEVIHKSQDNSQQHLVDLSNFIFLNSFLSQDVVCDMEKVLKECSISPSNLMTMLFTCWLSSNCCDYWKSWEYFTKLLTLINNMLQHDSESENIDDDSYLIIWREIIDLIYRSTNITSALIATHVIKGINNNKRLEKLDEQTDNEKKLSACSSDLEWETLSVDNENLNFLIKQLEDVFLLELLLISVENDNKNKIDQSISLRLIMNSGPGIVSQLVATWAIMIGIKPDVLCYTNEESRLQYHDDDDDDDKMKVEEQTISYGEDALVDEKLDLKTSSELLDHVRRCFPNCLEPDVLLANCAWESLVIWENDPSTSSSELLKNSLVYLNLIISSVLKHNVACLIWKTFIQKRFETLASLMEKMGKMPKERICKKELGMDETCLENFLEYSCQLLDFIIENNKMAEIEPLPIFTIDEWWKTQTNESSIKSPLVIVAIHQKVANAALVIEHSRLATTMLFIAIFQLKGSRPLSLVSPVVHSYLFKDFHHFPVYYSNKDSKLIELRHKHLLSVVTAIANSVPVFEKNKDCDQEMIITTQSKLHSEANKWFGKVICLSKEWELNPDDYRQHFVCELYKNGCDSLAEEIITSVVDLTNLGKQMLNIAGKRVVCAINEKYGTIEQMHTLQTVALFWLKSLTIDNEYHSTSYELTLTMIEHINNYVYSDLTLRRICEGLIEAMQTLINSN